MKYVAPFGNTFCQAGWVRAQIFKLFELGLRNPIAPQCVPNGHDRFLTVGELPVGRHPPSDQRKRLAVGNKVVNADSSKGTLSTLARFSISIRHSANRTSIFTIRLARSFSRASARPARSCRPDLTIAPERLEPANEPQRQQCRSEGSPWHANTYRNESRTPLHRDPHAPCTRRSIRPAMSSTSVAGHGAPN
jgi:hypothetical protein